MNRHRLRIVVPAFPSFNIYSRIARATTALGPICVATSANKLPNWDVEVVDENNADVIPRDKSGLPDHVELQKQRPADLVGFYGSLSSTIPRAYHLAMLYKNMGIPTIAGGKHIEAMPEEALRSGIDVVVFGEGDYVIQELMTAWESQQSFDHIHGIALWRDGLPAQAGQMVKTPSRPLITDFEALPMPDFGLLRHARPIHLYPLSWIRGCNMNCEFCSVKSRARRVCPERLAAQVMHLVETRGARHFFIVDDHFSEDTEGAIKFCQIIADYQKRIKRRLGFSVQIRLNDAKKTDLLVAMKAAGVKIVFIGFESPIDAELKVMRKGYTSQHMVEWTRVFHNYGFFIHGMFMFGYPRKDDDPAFSMPLAEKVKHFRKFISQARIDTAQVLLTVPLPGTELRDRLDQAGRLYPLGWEYYDGQFPLFVPDDGVSPEELQAAVNRIMSTFYHFHHFFKVALLILYFPLAMIPAFSLQGLKQNYKQWRYSWRNTIVRIGGYFVVRQWSRRFRNGNFSRQLTEAKSRLTHQPR